MTIDQLTAFFGWAAIINILLLLLSAAALLVLRGPITRIHTRLFGLDEKDLGRTPAQLAFRSGGPPCAELLYTPELLREAFAELEILRLEEYQNELREGAGHVGQAALIDLVARRPVADSAPALDRVSNRISLHAA